jgi:cell filamentation protein
VSIDPYIDPATGVLINLLGIRDHDALRLAEADIVTARLVQVQRRPIPGEFDVAHLQALHRHLFGDVFPWAGDFRTVNIARSASFGDWRHVRQYLDQLFAVLRAEHHLQGLDGAKLVHRLAYYFGEVNAAHPFREGNGRTQRAFLGQLARNAGWELRWSRITREQNNMASEASLAGDLVPLERLIGRALLRAT